jgi:hypothetical protein
MTANFIELEKASDAENDVARELAVPASTSARQRLRE